MSLKNLYDNKSFFRLTSGNQTVNIQEPINWDKADFTVPRDAVYFGFVSEFIGDSIQLQFPRSDEAAYYFIKNIYDTQSGDGAINFDYGIIVNNKEQIIFPATLNLNTYVNDEVDGERFITCSVEKVNFESLFRTRFETDVDFSSYVSFDNKPIGSPYAYNMRLHSRKISKEFKSTVESPREFDSYDNNVDARGIFSIKIDTTDGQIAELGENQALPLSISSVDPRTDRLYFFEVAEAGFYDINFKASMFLRMQIVVRGEIKDYNIVPRLMIERGGVTIDYTEFSSFRVTGSHDYKFFEFNYSFDISHVKRELQVGDLIYLDVYCVTRYGNDAFFVNVSNYTSTVDLLAETAAVNSYANAYRAFDAVTKMVEYVTGVPNAVKSSVLQPSGDMYSTFITNGYQIRNFDIFNKPVITNLKDFFESFCAIRGLGYAIEPDNGKDYIVIEPIEYFFKDSEITFVKDVYNYREEHAKDRVYNEFEIGFDKYPDSDANTLDEYNTYQKGLFPIRTYKQKFTKKSKYIGSGYLIEKQRREQFEKNPSESMSNDDDIFILSGVEGRERISTTHTVTNDNRFNFVKDLGLSAGDSFTVERGGYLHANDGRIFTIKSTKTENDGTFTYIVNEQAASDSGQTLVSFPIFEIRSERNEMFSLISGVLSPDSAYNLRLSPRRILLNWSKFLNIMLSFKTDGDLIQNTFVKNNSSMQSQLDVDDPFRLYQQNDVIVESSDISVADFRKGNRKALHLPVYCYFDAPMKYDQFLLIKDSLIGKTKTSTDHGYIAHPDDDGGFWCSYVYSIKYAPKTEIATIQAAKFRIY